MPKPAKHDDFMVETIDDVDVTYRLVRTCGYSPSLKTHQSELSWRATVGDRSFATVVRIPTGNPTFDQTMQCIEDFLRPHATMTLAMVKKGVL